MVYNFAPGTSEIEFRARLLKQELKKHVFLSIKPLREAQEYPPPPQKKKAFSSINQVLLSNATGRNEINHGSQLFAVQNRALVTGNG